MNTYNVIQIGSQRELLIGIVEANDEQEAIYNAVQEFGNNGDFSESDFRVELKMSAQESYKTYLQNREHTAEKPSFTILYQGSDYNAAAYAARVNFGFVVRDSDGAVDGEDGWAGHFDPFFKMPTVGGNNA